MPLFSEAFEEMHENENSTYILLKGILFWHSKSFQYLTLVGSPRTEKYKNILGSLVNL